MKTLYRKCLQENDTRRGGTNLQGLKNEENKMSGSSEVFRGWREKLKLRLLLWPRPPPNFNLLQEYLFTSYCVTNATWWLYLYWVPLTSHGLLWNQSGFSLALYGFPFWSPASLFSWQENVLHLQDNRGREKKK